MTNRFEPQRDNPLRPLGTVGDVTHDAVDGPDDEEELDRTDALPEHERDDDRTLGGGVMTIGGTTVDRGTGTLTGTAQDHGAGNDDDDATGVDVDFGEDDADRALGRDR
jgi:hypothetical protein